MILRYHQRAPVEISSCQQQVSSVVAARDFLLRLTQSKETPRVPGEVRREARALLRHYPIASRLRPVLEEGLSRSECGGLLQSSAEPEP